MRRFALAIFLATCVTTLFAQQNTPAQRSDRSREAEESSSRDTRIDISAPSDDAKKHPNSVDAVSDLVVDENAPASDVQEMRPWNPMKAMKDIEVGDYYFKRRNYRAALDRYKEALYYKDSDAISTFRIAQCEEKIGTKEDAKKYYESYLKILPQGPFAKEAQASIDGIGKNEKK